jgi:parallel beta-helix repeat protein
MKTTMSLCLGLIFALATLRVSATNYYVDPSSTGSNQGTFDNPWRSIGDIPWAINYYAPGDTIFFKRGQYFTGTLSLNSSGSNGAPIVLMPYGSGNAPVFQYDAAHNTEPNIYDRVHIRLNQCNNIVVDGFELTDATMPEADHTVTANIGYGVYIYKGSNNTVKNLTITRLGSGVAIDQSNYNTITNCTIRNLRIILNTPDVEWDDFGAMGIMVGGSDNTITYNQIHDCYGNSYDYQIDGGAIEMYGAVSNNKIMYNTASENLGFMEFGSASVAQALNNTVAYNLLINNGHVFWINTNNIYGVNVANLQFLNNNIVETHPHRLSDVRNLIGIAATPSISNVLTMKNNIFWLSTPINITDPNAQPFNGPQLVHQNNLFHMVGGSMGYTLDVTEKTLQAGVSLFKDIVSSSNPISWDYGLQPASAAIDFGQHTGIVKDFYGKAVPFGGVPDAGIAENISVILPIEILSCRGWQTESFNVIEWETNADAADHFEIEKSTGGNNFNKIATIPYKTPSGTLTVKYQYTDYDKKGDVLYYRIKAVESANKGSYSKIISIKSNQQTANITITPNPAQDYVYVELPGNDLLNKEMQLINMSGVVLNKQKVNETGSRLKLNVSNLPKGAFVIKLIDGKTGENRSALFTK